MFRWLIKYTKSRQKQLHVLNVSSGKYEYCRSAHDLVECMVNVRLHFVVSKLRL